MDKELSYSFPSDSQMDSKVLPHVTVVKGAMDADEVFTNDEGFGISEGDEE